MTVSQMIEKLEQIKSKYGNIEIYFDCPKCDLAFSPNQTVTTAIHLTEKK